MTTDGRHGPRRVALLVGLVFVLIAALAPAPAAAQTERRFRALVFTKTAAFRHDSIPAGIAAIQELAAANNFTVDHTEDSTQFNDANLANYDVVIWLNTTGDVLNDTEQGAFERYMQAGGGYAGVHSAADTEYDWPWYGNLTGAYFQSHPAVQEATVKVADRVHPATQHLPASWVRTDEWYNYRTNPRGNVHVLAALEETSYSPGSGAMGFDHPVAWCQDFDGGRSFYTGGGHTIESFSETAFRQHLLGGIETASGVTPADCGATVSSNFEKVALDTNTSDPFELDVAPDGRVFFVERGGDVKIYRPDTQSTVTAGHIDVFTGQENGLMGIALDPAFATNGWAYLFYAATGTVACPAADPGATSCGPQRLSRFTVTGNSLDMASEQVLLEFPIQRDQCCHSAGSLDFDAQGNLYLTTGDNANPFASNGYTPIDEREGRSSWDAQRTSANTNDLRGKVLRIQPEPDGTYSIPAGNLFPAGTTGTRPEIYAMGLRNPFRMTVDPETGWVYVADYGPDATAPDATRGPAGYVEWNQIRAAGNYGWPYCHGNQFAYNDYDFATGTSGALFDCAAPVNESPNNTGLVQLPSSQPPNVWYSYDISGEFPELGTGCGCPMAGPVYHFDPDLQSERKFPAYYDDTPFFYDWGRGFIKEFKQDESGELLDIYPFLPTETYQRPMDMTFGPDGAMYLLEWGTGFGGGNPDSGLYRIDYVKGTRRPIAMASATPDSGAVPLTVQFSSEGTHDPDVGDQLTYAWDFESDGTVDSTEPNPSHTYTTAGNYTAQLTVTDTSGKTAVANVQISAGNTRPTVTIDAPPDGGFFDFGDEVAYSVSVSDPEDGTVNCAEVQMEFILGHDAHGHPLSQQTGCEGTIQTASDDGHGASANLFGILEATYTDKGAPGVAPLTGRAQVLLQPKRKQAEHFTQNQGVQLEGTSDEGGGQNIGFIDNGDYISFAPMNLLNIDSLVYRVASGGAGGTIEVHVDSPSGPLISTATITPTGGWQKWTSVEAAITDPGGTHELFFVFKNESSQSGLFNINWVEFVGKGVSVNAAPRVSATANPMQGEVPLTVDFAATATDPENDPVTFAWDFGDGGSATGANVSHTYETSGTFTATVTGTDSGGRSSTDTVQVQVVPLASPPIECTDPGSDPGPDDEFDGDRLDGCRWDAVVRPDYNGFRVEGGLLKIDTTPTNLFDQHNNAPNLMLQTWPYDDWTVETKVVAPVSERWQQGGILVYLSDATFLKFDVVGTSDPGVDPGSAVRKVEIRHEIGDEFQPDFPEVIVPHTPGDVYYLRLQKRGSEYTGFYSLDGTTWQQLADPVTNTALAGANVGLYAFGQEQTTSTTVGFDYFHLVESSAGSKVSASATPTKGNVPLEVQFTGTSVYGEGEATYAWDFGDGASAEGLNATHTYTEPGTYTATLTATDLEGSTSSDSVQIEATAPCTTPSQPEAGYTMLFDGTNQSLTNWKQAGPGYFEHEGCTIKSVGGLGLFWYDQGQEFNAPYSLKLEWMMPGDDNSGVFVGFPDPGDDPYIAVNQGEEIQIDATDDPDSTTGAIYNEQAPDAADRDAALNPPGEWNEFEIRVEADRIIVYLNGQKINEWINDDPNVDLATGYIGLQNHGGSDDVFFRNIRITDGTPPETTATLSPEAPDGENGWYVSPVEVTLDASDDLSGVPITEYRVDDGPWTEYTGPFEVGEDGEHVVDFRSTDEAGNVEETKSVIIKIDRTAPEVTCVAAPNQLWPPNLKLRDVTVNVQVTDATSGAAGFTLENVTSNEPDSPVPGDIQAWDIGAPDTTGKLRAERSGRGKGRVYTITYKGRDEAGNTALCYAAVTVPKRRPGA